MAVFKAISEYLSVLKAKKYKNLSYLLSLPPLVLLIEYLVVKSTQTKCLKFK